MHHEKVEAYIGIAFGTFFLVAGTFLALGFWSEMQQIQAQGLVGQAFNEDTYEESSFFFQVTATLAVTGLAFLIISAGEYVSGTLEGMRSD